MVRKHPMRAEQIVQFSSEILVAVGLGIGLFPFGYVLTAAWVVPLAVLNLILAIVYDNDTKKYTIPNVAIVLFSLIPIIGWPARVIGAALAIAAARELATE